MIEFIRWFHITCWCALNRFTPSSSLTTTVVPRALPSAEPVEAKLGGRFTMSMPQPRPLLVVPSRPMPEMLSALNAFLEEHRRCGELDGGVNWRRVWMACDCGSEHRLPARVVHVRSHPVA